MKLTVKINNILSVLLVAAAFTACDDIKESERFLPVEEVKPVRAVLIEEFTGQSCRNCPKGHKAIEALRKQYGTAVIPVSIHASNLAYADGELGSDFQGFKTDDGERYYRESGAEALPNAVVDRCSGSLKLAEWTAVVEKRLKEPSPVVIEVDANLAKDNSRNLNIDVTLKSTANLSANLQVWLTESGIVSYQDDNGADIMDYTHNHIFRCAVNNHDGEKTEISANVFKKLSYSYELKEKWVPANMAVVAFLYDGSGVIQTVEVPLTLSGSAD